MVVMENNKNPRHREMTEERKAKRKRIMAYAIAGAGATCNQLRRGLGCGNIKHPARPME